MNIFNKSMVGKASSGLAVTVLLLISLSQTASAALVQFQSQLIEGNECGAGGFSECILTVGGQELSPVIIKYDGDLSLGPESDISSGFPSIDGSEFDLTGTGFNNGTGTWTYDPGVDDPDVRYWIAKASNGYNVFWNVDDIDIGGAGDPCDALNDDSTTCLLAAQSSTSGSWTTPLKTSGASAGDPRDLSHITFFDTEGIIPPPTPPDEGNVPVPAAVWLFGTGLIGMMGFTRRKSA